MTDSRHEGNNAVDEERGEAGPADGGRAEKRSPHSIRFLDPEWERIEAHAETRGLTGPEFVRFAALAAMAGPPPSAAGDRLAPLIEMTFRATYIMATRMRDEMLDARPQGRAGRARRRRPRAAGRDTGRRTGPRKRVDEDGFPPAAPANGDRAAGRSAISAQPPAIHSWRVGGLARSGASHRQSPYPGTAPPAALPVASSAARVKAIGHAVLNRMVIARTPKLVRSGRPTTLPTVQADKYFLSPPLENPSGCGGRPPHLNR